LNTARHRGPVGENKQNACRGGATEGQTVVVNAQHRDDRRSHVLDRRRVPTDGDEDGL
jgi:hypothetical protein